MENGQSRLQQAQKEVDEVTVIMLDNINKASEREGKLGELENRADELREKSKVFSKTTVQVKQKKRFENMKWKLVAAGVSVGVIIIIIIILIVSFSGNKDDT
ncbi:vesicle-associated membrane protein 5-like [Hoplias malabaricus]|uniref:vesicle-associated membrane protein 5-like n=1 Tax=Hoplias malabaricus TaxID=27720 RepID=UPI0034631307